MKNVTIGDVIKKYRKDNGISMEEFGKRCGLSKAYISLIERNKNTRSDKPIVPSIDTVLSIADAMNMDLDELLNETDPNQKVRINEPKIKGIRIPVLGRVIAGIPIAAITDVLDYEEITPELARSGDFFALQVKGKSMEPKLYENDVVIVKQQPDVESGETAIVLVNGNDATVKQIQKSASGITLVGYNVAAYKPKFYSNEEIENLPVQILGKVIELRRKF